MKRARVIDNTVAMDCEVRYRPAAGWQCSARWVYGGGRPYTPYDTMQTRLYNAAIFEYDQANEVRYPAYHSLNVRLQREIVFSGSRLVIYGEVWNVYDRDNVAGQYWNEVDRRFEMVNQFPRIPVIGVEYRF